uniref:Ig-like domain-containing protein n=1 Tax=Dicentrarchus labrax TaxID=13489 RepID=A0A8P4G689_DICLA
INSMLSVSETLLWGILWDEVSVESGSDVTLPCRAPTDLTAVRWSRPELGSDHYVFFYRDRRLYEEYQHPAYRGRVSLVDRGLEHADASVTLRRASFRDTGTYECVTVSSRGHRKRTSEFHCAVISIIKGKVFSVSDPPLSAGRSTADKQTVIFIV